MLIWELQYEDQRLHFLLFFFKRGKTEQVLKPGQGWYCSWKVMKSSFNRIKPLKHETDSHCPFIWSDALHVDFDAYSSNKLFSKFLHKEWHCNYCTCDPSAGHYTILGFTLNADFEADVARLHFILTQTLLCYILCINMINHCALFKFYSQKHPEL